MKEIIVKSQAALDAIATDYDGRIIIKFGTQGKPAIINRQFKGAELYGASRAELYGDSRAWLYDDSRAMLHGDSRAVLYGDSRAALHGDSRAWLYDDSRAELYDDSRAALYDDSRAWLYDDSRAELYDDSRAALYDDSRAELYGNAQAVDRSATHNITTHGNARIVYDPHTIEEYADAYGIDIIDGKIKLYKAVHKTADGVYVSDYDRNFRYTIGNTITADELDTDAEEDCGHGIHMAHKAWCVDYGRKWDGLAILEVEADADGVIVPHNCKGKGRAAQVKVIREVPLEECGLLGEMLARRMPTQPPEVEE